MTERKKKPWWRWLLLIVGGSIAVGIPCLFILALLGPTIGRLTVGQQATKIADTSACSSTAMRARVTPSLPVPLAAFDLFNQPAYPTISADDAGRLAEVEQFAVTNVNYGHTVAFLGVNEVRVIGDLDRNDLPMTIRPDGMVAAVIEVYSIEEYGLLRFCDVATGDQLAASTVKDSTHHAAFTPDGLRLVVNEGRGTLTVYDAQTFRQINEWTNVRRGEPYNIIVGLAVHPDSQLIAYAGSDDDTVRLWNLDAGQEVARLSGHTDGVVGLAFSPDGTRLASLSTDGTLRVWAVQDQ